MSLPFRLLCLGMTAMTGFAATYSFTTVDYPATGIYTVLTAVNNRGQIAGSYGPIGLIPPPTGFLTDLTGTVGPSLQVPNAQVTYPTGIDNLGQVLGIFYSGAYGVFLRTARGTFSTIPLPNGLTFAWGAAISARGSIVLSAWNNLYFQTTTGYNTVPVPGAGSGSNAVTVTGIDNSGNTVGFYYPDSGFAQSFYRDTIGNFQAIDYPGSVYTEIGGVDNFGQAVGFYSDGTRGHGFLWNHRTNTFVTVDYPGSVSTALAGINDSGNLVGSYIDANGAQHGFIATPVR